MLLFKKIHQSALRMVNGTERPFDLVIFGASGYTGQCVIEYVVRAVEQDFKKAECQTVQCAQSQTKKRQNQP